MGAPGQADLEMGLENQLRTPPAMEKKNLFFLKTSMIYSFSGFCVYVEERNRKILF